MNAKRMTQWLIVLLLLAALPVMTVTLAQEEQPGKQLPSVTEPGESAVPQTYNVYESENNNTPAAADDIRLNDVMGGQMDQHGDVDWFIMQGSDSYYLIDIEAESIGSYMDPVVCVEQGWVEYCNDDTDTVDSLLFYNPNPSYAGPFHIKVSDFNGSGGWKHHYELIVSTPLLVSAAAGGLGTGYVAGIPFTAQDILAHSDLNTGDEKWVMFFDGSDVGITKNLTNLAADWMDSNWDPNDNILIGLAANQPIVLAPGWPNHDPANAVVGPYDILQFYPTQYGPETIGQFAIYMNGPGDLSTAGEKIDAFDGFKGYGACYGDAVSTTGAASVPDYSFGYTVYAQDEDLLCREYEDDDYTPAWWALGFDGSNARGLKGEDVVAVATANRTFFLTILGSGKIHGHAVNQKDIFAINLPNYTWGGYMWRGSQHGWNYNIDAFEFNGG